ncbi:hypothetical protein FHW58_004971 [Duganella sp. 1224]|uniref:hypothetical protein n=1 Tax=Duganella sp. 1224 TaxID=2587052 RepID=UPI0015CDE125|nr:hypothetical protein [Duganella sp. 1224]NYE63740.1 hypothetical protein [Duganella sp. 1224]
MRWFVFAATMLLCSAVQAGDCIIRVGYPDRERPPYYLGHGTVVPERPGAAVDLIRMAVSQIGCMAQLVRLPNARLKFALVNGSIDMAPVDLRDGEQPYSALPLHLGVPDTRRGIRVLAVVYVRVIDAIPSDTDPRHYFRNHKLATIQGAPLGEQLRDEGYVVDGGAADAYGNLKKVMLHRADGFAVSIANVNAMDSIVTTRYGGQLLRLHKPMRASTVWLSASNDYYRQNVDRMEHLWDWWGDNAASKLNELVRGYAAIK